MAGSRTALALFTLLVLSATVTSAAAQDAGALTLQTVTFDRRPTHSCQITTHHADENYLFLFCDNGGGTYCYESFRADLARPADSTPDTRERVVVCPNLGAGMQLVAVTDDAWTLLGAVLYGTAGDSRRPIIVVAADVVPDPQSELVVRIPVASGEHTEVLRVASGGLVSVLSFESHVDNLAVVTETRAEWHPFGPGTVLLSSTVFDHGEDHDSFRVARWDDAAGRFRPAASCPDPRPFVVRGVEGVLRSGARLTASERRDGWSLRSETSVLGWTATSTGCPAVLVRVASTATLAGDAPRSEDRGVTFGVIAVDARSRQLRVVDRPGSDDPRVVEVLRNTPSTSPAPASAAPAGD